MGDGINDIMTYVQKIWDKTTFDIKRVIFKHDIVDGIFHFEIVNT